MSQQLAIGDQEIAIVANNPQSVVGGDGMLVQESLAMSCDQLGQAFGRFTLPDAAAGGATDGGRVGLALREASDLQPLCLRPDAFGEIGL